MDNKKNPKKARKGIVWCAAILILLAAGAFTALRLYKMSVVPRTIYVEIEDGADYAILLDSLRSGGKVRPIWLFDAVARARGLDKAVKPGHYQLREGMSANAAVLLLRSGHQAPVNLIFNNVRTLDQLAGRFGAQLTADSADFAALILSDSVAAAYGFTPENFISMFIPNTYQVYATTTPAALLDRMYREYDKFWNGVRDGKIAATGLETREEVSALASIVMEESSKADEFTTIAGVYVNRIRKGIPLQADPTVKFALGQPELRRVRRKHLEVESPYNTYKNTGVPPGPIRMPSIAAIDAVLGYEHHDYIFFCAKSDFSGYHVFAKTLAEHNRNAQAYARALNEAGIM